MRDVFAMLFSKTKPVEGFRASQSEVGIAVVVL